MERYSMSDPTIGGAFDSIEAFVSTAEGVVATGQNLDEANTKAKILTPLVRTLGWPVHDNTEVLLEYSEEEDPFDDRADYALINADELYAVIEAKRIGEPLSKHSSQIRKYMRFYGAEWGLLTNGENYQIFRSEDDTDEVLVESLSLADLPTSEYIQKLSRDNARSVAEVPEPVNRVSEAKIEEIVELSQETDLYDKMIGSIAPSVCGYEVEKLAVLLALFGGVEKSVGSDRHISGAIDILLVHDPTIQLSKIKHATRRLAPDSAYFSDSGIKVNSKPQREKSLIQTRKPKYGRFDNYDPIGEQIDLEPDRLSQFDVIFTINDDPDPDRDGNVSDNILKTHHTGELNTHHNQATNSKFTQQQVDDMAEEIAPVIEPELLRKYIAHAKRSCYPAMTDEAKSIIRQFYVDVRSKGADEDVPVPITDHKLETLVRLAEASARVRLSNTVEEEDAKRSVEIVRSGLQDTVV
jgi:DNA replicative helicase MCM subunit Mcm2 (Cdc46/Mcm family)